MGLPRGIRERGDKFFVDVSLKGQRKTATCDTLTEAVAKQAELRSALETGTEVSTARSNARVWTLREAVDKCAGLAAPDGWRGSKGEKQALINAEAAVKFMGPHRLLDTITRPLLDGYCVHLESEGNSDGTINRKLSALSKVLKVARDYDGVPELPKMPRLRKERVGRIRFITDKEEDRLLDLMVRTGREDLAAFITVLIDTGMRRGELLALRPQDIDLKTGVVMVYGTEGKGTKNGGIRSVPMTKRVQAILAERLDERVLCFDLKESEIRHAWDWAKGRMGLTEDKDFVLHVCRHTCASRLVRGGVSLPIVKDWLGHSDIKTTMRYAHLYPQDLMNAAAALERGN